MATAVSLLSLLVLQILSCAVGDVVTTIEDDWSTSTVDPCDSSTDFSTRIQLTVIPGDGNFSYIGETLIPEATGLKASDVTLASYELITVNTRPKGRQRLFQRQNSGSNIRLQTVTDQRRGRKFLGAVTVGVDECDGQFDSGVRMQLRFSSRNGTAMAELKKYVEDGDFERGIVDGGEACAAEVKGRAYAKNGVEIKERNVNCRNS